MKIEGWNLIDEEGAVLWREYEFSRGATATSLVFRGSEGLVVVSPPSGLSARDYDALAELGEVRALVANNSFHHLGQRPWRARFKDAESYCPPGAVEKLTKKTKGVPFRPLTDLALPASAHWEDAPGFKTGEALLAVKTGRGQIWFTGDLLTNISRVPGGPFGWIMKWIDAAPGFRLFKPAVWLAVSDRKAVRAWVTKELAERPPSIVVTSHGPPVDTGDVLALAMAQIEKL